MKGSGESIISALAFEFTPAAIFGSAVAFASSVALALPFFGVVPIVGGIVAFAVSWLALRRLGRASKSLPLATFDQSELERELANLAEELQQSEAVVGQSTDGVEFDELLLEDELSLTTGDELLLEEELNAPQTDSRVIRLFDPAVETAGEMQARIVRHLGTTPRPQLSDATQELHEALSALRRSLR